MNIFVGNLSFRATNAELEELFAQYGDVDSAAIINDRDTGRSRGFGFVTFAEGEDAALVEQRSARVGARAVGRARRVARAAALRRRRRGGCCGEERQGRGKEPRGR